MTGKQRRDTKSLKGMFSTRAQRDRVPTVTTSAAEVQQAKQAPEAVSQPTSTKSEPKERPAPKPAQSTKPKTPTMGRSAELTPLGSLVMREARREIGSDSSMQQQLASAGKTELVIAQAVDRVLRKRGESLDDLERANVIISLQKDLVGMGSSPTTY